MIKKIYVWNLSKISYILPKENKENGQLNPSKNNYKEKKRKKCYKLSKINNN